MRVLIVDDSSVARKMLKRALPPGFSADFSESDSGSGALEILRAQKIDVMFLDLTMPGIDGFGVLEAIKTEPIASPYVIVLSADIQERAQARVKELGARRFLKKPADQNTIRQALEDAGAL
jgi:CheY-like chemotaxis protein